MLEALVVQFMLVPAEHVFVASGLIQWALRTLGGASTQNLLNEAEAPIPRDLAVGYAEILLALSVTMVYGPGLPLLYFFAAAGFGMRFWCVNACSIVASVILLLCNLMLMLILLLLCRVEKWADLSVYKKPPLLDGDLFKNFDQIMMAMVTISVLMANHFVSSAGGLHPEIPRKHDTFGRPHAIPMFVVFLVVMISFSVKIATKVFPMLHEWCYRLPGGDWWLHDRQQ